MISGSYLKLLREITDGDWTSRRFILFRKAAETCSIDFNLFVWPNSKWIRAIAELRDIRVLIMIPVQKWKNAQDKV